MGSFLGRCCCSKLSPRGSRRPGADASDESEDAAAVQGVNAGILVLEEWRRCLPLCAAVSC